jgi:hypothetical protein
VGRVTRSISRVVLALALALGVPLVAASDPNFVFHIYGVSLLLVGIALVIRWRKHRLEAIADLRVSMQDLRADPEMWKSRLGGSIRSVYSARSLLSSYASYLLDHQSRVAVLEQSRSPQTIAENGRWAADLLGVPFDPYPAGGPNLRIGAITFLIVGVSLFSVSMAYDLALLGLCGYLTTLVGFLLLYWVLADQ